MKALRTISIIFAAALGGCSLSTVIDGDVVDYYDTAATANNRLLLLNILRAKDDAPVHFSELALIHGVVSASAGVQASLPFGHHFGTSPRDTLTPSVNFSTSPTFDLSTLETQDFTRGIMAPLDPKVIKNFLDNGLDSKIALLLFFSEIKLPTKTLSNDPSCDRSGPSVEKQRVTCKSKFYEYFEVINHLSIEPFSYTDPPTPVGAPFDLKMEAGTTLKDVLAMDPTKFKISQVGKQYQLYSISSDQHVAFCIKDTRRSGGTAATFSNQPVNLECGENEAKTPIDDKSKNTGVLSVRSVYGIIKYLGGILAIQELEPHRCITIGGRREPGDEDFYECEKGDVLFQVNPSRFPSAFHANYRNIDYSIGVPSGCEYRHDIALPCDHSLQALAVVELLLNMNKIAKDITVTPRIQLVQ